jgi:Na+/melibiose symporter-like transporter
VSTEPDHEPSRAVRFRPIELVGLAGFLALFAGFFVWLSTHANNPNPWPLVLIFTGISFIVSLVVIAMCALAFKPDTEELDDLDEQDKSPH